MGKPTICIGENKGADQLPSNSEVDQRVCFYATWIVQFLLFLNPKFPASNLQVDLCRNWSVTLKTSFLVYRLIYNLPGSLNKIQSG